MKFVCLLLLPLLLPLAGCTTSQDPDDVRFFNRHWWNPREIDNDPYFGAQPTEPRMPRNQAPRRQRVDPLLDM